VLELPIEHAPKMMLVHSIPRARDSERCDSTCLLLKDLNATTGLCRVPLSERGAAEVQSVSSEVDSNIF
jgi:hypothetical protein